MKQVVQSARGGRPSVCDVPVPHPEPGHILVRTRASLISAGTERMVVDFAAKSLAQKARARPDLVRKVLEKARRDGLVATAKAVFNRLDEPLPLGYAAAGEVVAVGEGGEARFRVGDRVAVAGAGIANHAEYNLVPVNLAVAVPEDVPDQEACYATLSAIAMHAVRQTGAGLGDTVAVVGVGLVGQIATQLLSLAGARVLALDIAPDRLDLALKLGAEAACDLSGDSLDAVLAALTGGAGCDAVLVAAAAKDSGPFATAAEVARDRARVVVVGLTGTEVPYREFMAKELTLTVSRSYGPGRYDADYEDRGVKYPIGYVRWTETANLAESVRLMAPGARRLDVAALTTHRFEVAEAEAAYGLILEASEPHLGVVLTYPDAPVERAAVPAAPAPAAASPAAHCVLGLIGAGQFARAVLLPDLRRIDGLDLRTVVSQRGLSAAEAQRRFGFDRAESDPEAIFTDPAINAVLIATRHRDHADLVCRALRAGKHVLVEKPLALSLEELDAIATARAESTGFFQVGFNRRFAPMTDAARARLNAAGSGRSILIRVNAGALPADSWQNAPEEGGGRLVGELCHFIDLAADLAGAAIIEVAARAVRGEGPAAENVTVTLSCADGGLATIVYTALGPGAMGKELIEGYAGGTGIRIEDFRRLEVDGAEKGTAQDKGHGALLRAFANAVTAGGPPPVPEAELLRNSAATLAVLQSLRTGGPVEISPSDD